MLPRCTSLHGPMQVVFTLQGDYMRNLCSSDGGRSKRFEKVYRTRSSRLNHCTRQHDPHCYSNRKLTRCMLHFSPMYDSPKNPIHRRFSKTKSFSSALSTLTSLAPNSSHLGEGTRIRQVLLYHPLVSSRVRILKHSRCGQSICSHQLTHRRSNTRRSPVQSVT